MADEDGIESTGWRFLRDLYLRLLTVHAGVDVNEMPEEERALLLEPHHKAMEHDLRVMMTIVDQGKSEALSSWRERIHLAEGQDHEMLDEALSYAATADQESETPWEP